MSSQTCNNRLVCPGSDSPFANLSSEANDPALFIGVNWCWGPGWSGRYPRVCFTEGNQFDADLCAATLCFIPVPGHAGAVGFDDAPDTGPSPPGGGSLTVGPPEAPPDNLPAPIQDPPGSDDYVQPPPLTAFWNIEQTCVACCVDGPCETFTMPAGTIWGRDQIEADHWARQFACRSAGQLALADCPDANCLIIDGILYCLPDILPPYNPPAAIALFWNGLQTCVASCPDGTTNSYTVRPGIFAGHSQGQADTAANSYACRQALRNRICLSDLAGQCCIGTASTFTISGFGGLGSVTWAATGGSLPAGMSISVAGRIVTITGIPTTAGISTFSLKVTDAVGNNREKSFTIDVMGITNDFALPGGSNNVAYSAQLNADGGTGPYTFEKISGALPFGVSMDSSGLISGTPQEPESANFPFQAQVTDSTGRVCTKALNIFIQSGCIIIDATPLPVFDQGQAYSYQFTAEGGTAPYTFVITSGVLPTGLSLSSSGLISGTATLVNGNLNQTFTVKATDSGMPPLQCSSTFTLPVTDYNNFPAGKKFRIKTYFNGYFNRLAICPLGGPLSPVDPIWDGNFDNRNGPADFRSSHQLDGSGTMRVGVTNGGLVNSGIEPVRLSTTSPYSGEWWLTLPCITVPANLWYGKKVGSNAGSQLDSPVGIYTLQTGLLGQDPVCGLNPTVEIEEY